jgi:leucine-zipper of insertion element IS481
MVGRSRSMKGPSQPRPLSAAQRGQVVQRIIVDKWTTADAAAVAGVPERLVAAWVADYRRNGMASLRRPSRRTVAAEIVQSRLLRPARFVLRGVAIGMSWLFAWERRPVSPSPIRRSQDDRRGGS